MTRATIERKKKTQDGTTPHQVTNIRFALCLSWFNISMAHFSVAAAVTFLNPNSKNHHLNCHNNCRLFAPILSPHHFKPFSLSPSSPFRLYCRGTDDDSLNSMSMAAAYSILGVQPDCSAAQLKASFRAKVCHFITHLFNWNTHTTHRLIGSVILRNLNFVVMLWDCVLGMID